MLGSVYTERQRQRCYDASNIGLIGNNVSKWSHSRIALEPILHWLNWFQWELCHKRHCSIDSSLTLMLSVNGPLGQFTLRQRQYSVNAAMILARLLGLNTMESRLQLHCILSEKCLSVMVALTLTLNVNGPINVKNSDLWKMKQFKRCYLGVLYCYCALVYRNVVHFLIVPTKIRQENDPLFDHKWYIKLDC